MNLIQKLETYISKNKLLKTQTKSIKKWLKLEKSKSALETILAHNIVKLAWKPIKSSKYDVIIATSNTKFIKIYETIKKEDKIKLIDTPYDGIYTRNSHSVLTYDLKDKTYKTIDLKAWEVLPLVEILPEIENILVLDQIVNECLQ